MASLDRLCARRTSILRPGRRNGTQAELKNSLLPNEARLENAGPRPLLGSTARAAPASETLTVSGHSQNCDQNQWVGPLAVTRRASALTVRDVESTAGTRLAGKASSTPQNLMISFKLTKAPV